MREPLPANFGKAWTGDEDQILERRFRDGESVEQLAHFLGRTKSSVRLRLEKLGRIDP